MLRMIVSCACALGLTFSAANYDPMANWLAHYKTEFEWAADSTIELIEHFEGVRTRAYQDSNGNWTIGIGHLIRSEEAYMLNRELSKDEVRGILHQDLEKCSMALKTAIRVPITPQQRDAMQSLCHNIGPDNMVRSEVVQQLNRGYPHKAANAFLNWSNPPDLRKRRQYERALFLRSI